MYCNQCGGETNPNAKFCQSCGAELQKPKSVLDENGTAPKQAESVIDSSDDQVPIRPSKAFLGGMHHPWRRFFARTTDIFTLGIVILLLFSFLVGYLFPQNIEGYINALENPISAGIILYVLWLPAEAAFIATMGTTPAKWIFGISVLDNVGQKLSYPVALKRALLVWIRGEGLGIPLVALFTRLFAYFRLTKTGTTLWDASTGSVVTHKRWGFFRATASVLVVILVLVIIGLLNSLAVA